MIRYSFCINSNCELINFETQAHIKVLSIVMKAEEYKSLINEKDVLDHTTLNVTLKELASRQEIKLKREINRILENNQIEKPELHSKPFDFSSTYYKVDLTSDDIEKIIDIFFELEASHVDQDLKTNPTASFYASLVDKWNQLT